jgi:hypothetical protein
VADVSWKEFMPKEVDEGLFRILLVFYDEDVIEGAGMRIRRIAKAADELMPTQRIMDNVDENCSKNIIGSVSEKQNAVDVRKKTVETGWSRGLRKSRVVL